MSVAPNSPAGACRSAWRAMAMMRSAPICLAARPTSAPLAANHPVPSTSERQAATEPCRRRAFQVSPPARRRREALACIRVDAAALVTGTANFAGIVRGEEGPDHELAHLDVLHIRADLFNEAHILVTHCGRFGRVVGTAVGQRSELQTQAAVSLMTASMGCWIAGLSRSSTRTSHGPGRMVARMTDPPCAC